MNIEDVHEDGDCGPSGKSIAFEEVVETDKEIPDMEIVYTCVYIVDEINNFKVFIGKYETRDEADEVVHAIQWYSGSQDEITTAEFGPPIT